MNVIKRDGTLEEYDSRKVIRALREAFRACNIEYPLTNIIKLAESIRKSEKESMTVEEIQDAVVKFLIDNKCYEVTKAYIIYKEQHKEDREDLERIQYMQKYRDSNTNAAQSSETDANANVAIKNVVNLAGEVYKVKNRRLQRLQMKMKLKELYPDSNLHKQYIKDLEHHIIYTHDESSTPVPENYCEAVSMYPLVDKGVGEMDGVTPKPPKWLNSFCGQFNNLVFLLSAQCKGAVAFGEFFNYFEHYCVIEFGENFVEKADLLASSEYVLHKQTIGDKIDEAFQSIVYYVNQPAGNRSYQSPFTNISYYDSYYWEALFKDFYFPDGTQPKWERVSWLQKRFMKWFNKERRSAMLTFFVETMALLTDKEGHALDAEYRDFTAEMEAEGHSFFVYLSSNPNGLASCCRLRSTIEENVFSFTNGLTGVMTGSCNVITLNLNRIIQDWYKNVLCGVYYDGVEKYLSDGRADILESEYEQLILAFKEYLCDILERVYCYQIAYKSILYEWEKAGMFTSSNAGYIHMNKLYSTIGINGINEAARFLGLEVNYNEKYKNFCRLVTSTIKEQNRLHSTKQFKFNCEFVPAEGLSSKNYNWDKNENYWVPGDTKIYNSYFYNAWDKGTSVIEKLKLHGREFTETLDGGVGCHINLEEHLSKEQYLKILDLAGELGTSYYTFNIPNSECTNKDCHYIVKYPMNNCPKCGSHMKIWTRVVGFLRPIEGYDEGRAWDAANRYYATDIN